MDELWLKNKTTIKRRFWRWRAFHAVLRAIKRVTLYAMRTTHECSACTHTPRHTRKYVHKHTHAHTRAHTHTHTSCFPLSSWNNHSEGNFFGGLTKMFFNFFIYAICCLFRSCTVPYLYEKWTQGQLWGVKNWFWEMGINTGLEGEEKHKLRPNQLF